ncbi:hypothetical protein HZF08_15725 [Paenibacillus sp. CGMCC 1.16610]|uniref:Tetratricopeptide repeat protein n=1 Tax=Paenibacillus anseongense TaxID=2682845 RepID=A0ABW9UGW8_9BACL|nr:MULTISPECIES: hypothetical protein [Paenibacillus]MBA2939762.1 hypothetical protein [Paenibacillus sp. CGMCC 1.16610]MVQ39422.1 hypothetical protein [Paenibacillus anseongense]
MNYLVFGHAGFNHNKLLNILPDKEEIIFIRRMDEKGAIDENTRFLSLSELASLDSQKYTAIVSSPYGLQHVLAFQPLRTIACIPQRSELEDTTLWDKYIGLLASYSDMIITESERTYLEQTLQWERVFLLRDSEELVRSAIISMLKGELLEQWVTKQWEERKRFYQSLHEQQGPHETICYLLASYLYFLGDVSAKMYLGISFEQMIKKEYSQCLNTHFRFFSAIEVKAGSLEKAVRTYEITAITDEERKSMENIRNWQEQGEWRLIQAEIFRANDDYRSAIKVLEDMGAKNSLQAATMRLQYYLHTYRWKDALALFDNYGLSDENRVTAEVIRGNIQLIHNKHHLAIRTFLRASVEDWNVLTNLNEIVSLEQAVRGEFQ